MKQINYKKLILPNIPYVFFVYLFDKVGQAVRLAPGADISAKILNITQGFSAAFESALPSIYPLDLLVGIVGAVIIRLIVYVKGKNAKKYRKGAEYGSARWGNAEDIKPYIDPEFQNNIILTQTERLTMNSRPKQPKYARNKNVVVIGGSGSGKTRFFVKPNLMQLHSSYDVFPHVLTFGHVGGGTFEQAVLLLTHGCTQHTGKGVFAPLVSISGHVVPYIFVVVSVLFSEFGNLFLLVGA